LKGQVNKYFAAYFLQINIKIKICKIMERINFFITVFMIFWIVFAGVLCYNDIKEISVFKEEKI